MKLFCFPYAGGSSTIYKDWQYKLGNNIKVVPFEMAGRGKKIVEPLCNDMDSTIDYILNEIENELLDGSYSLFGHSMGAIIVYNLLNAIVKRGIPKPKHVFFSGSKPPHIKDKSKNDHLLPDNEFLEVVKSHGGTSEEFFNNKELVDFFLPILRNDFKLAHTTVDSIKEIQSHDLDVTVFYGDNEYDLTTNDVYGWKLYTTKEISIHCIKGSHFFIDENIDDVLEVVNKKFSKVLVV